MTKEFDVEHALVLESASSFILPAYKMYSVEELKPYQTSISNSHIYMIGYMPIFETSGPGMIVNGEIVTSYLIAGEEHWLNWGKSEIPGIEIVSDNGGYWWFEDPEGKRYSSTKLTDPKIAQRRLSDEQNALPFSILYIGQAFGEDGSRHALDRLKNHEKLQEIILKNEAPKWHQYYLLLIQIEPGTELATLIDTSAQNTHETLERLGRGLSKLNETSEAEKTSLYEASLIRYFRPKYHTKFKESFPSTNMKGLADCYKYDIAAIIAKLCLNAEFQVCSPTVPQRKDHIIQHDLLTDQARKMFLGL